MSGSYDYDVIVVGTGFGGASAAESLARAGLKVGILERGTWWGAFGGHHRSAATSPEFVAAISELNLSGLGHKPQGVVARIRSTQDRIAQGFGRTKAPRSAEGQGASPWISCHPIGGCRMATDASRAVVDFRGEVFGHPGLYVADATVFPTMTIGGPQLSVSALASWIAERIIEDAGREVTLPQLPLLASTKTI